MRPAAERRIASPLLRSSAIPWKSGPAVAGEIEGVRTELVSIKGPRRSPEPADADACTVLIGVGGQCSVTTGGAAFDLVAESIARLPYAEQYEIDVAEDLIQTLLHEQLPGLVYPSLHGLLEGLSEMSVASSSLSVNKSVNLRVYRRPHNRRSSWASTNSTVRENLSSC